MRQCWINVTYICIAIDKLLLHRLFSSIFILFYINFSFTFFLFCLLKSTFSCLFFHSYVFISVSAYWNILLKRIVDFYCFTSKQSIHFVWYGMICFVCIYYHFVAVMTSRMFVFLMARIVSTRSKHMFSFFPSSFRQILGNSMITSSTHFISFDVMRQSKCIPNGFLARKPWFYQNLSERN